MTTISVGVESDRGLKQITTCVEKWSIKWYNEVGYTEIELCILLYKWLIIENTPRYNIALNVHLQPSFVVDGVSRCVHLLMLDSIYIIPAWCRIRQPNNPLTPIYFGPRPIQERKGIYLVNESYKTIKNWYNKDNKTKQGKTTCTFHESYYKHHFYRFFQGQIKNTIASRLWPLWGKFTGPVNSLHKRPVMRKTCPFNDVFMVPSKSFPHCWRYVVYVEWLINDRLYSYHMVLQWHWHAIAPVPVMQYLRIYVYGWIIASHLDPVSI